MVQSGAMRMTENNLRDQIEIEEERVMLLVHDIKPPFLDGRMVFTT